MRKKTLSIVCYDTLRHQRSKYAIKQTLSCIEADTVYWLSDKAIDEDVGIPSVTHLIDPITRANFAERTGDLCFNIIPSIVDTDFALYVQADGFALNESAWTDEFLEYDYIGAPWPFYKDGLGDVGNGGFSLRSRRLHDALLDLRVGSSLFNSAFEDTLICRTFRRQLEKDYGIRYAPIELAARFSMEIPSMTPNIDKWIGRSFGFHGGFLCHHYGYSFDELKEEG